MGAKPYVKYTIPIPEGVKVEIMDKKVKVSGPLGTIEKELYHPKVRIKIEDNNVVVDSILPRRRDAAMTGTIAAHIRNMIKGVTKGYTYRLRIVYAHFPMKVTVKGDTVVIENFLGERAPRHAKILPGVKVEVKGEEVIVSGIDKEKVGQTAANIELATRVRGFDIRKFQDGIYIVSKGE
ncbi:MAG: 50S ribosomal protein L6 [Euryarchaeota archaeon]|nr:50S ribosomal protein L6 [Euryarchaeota archaeon]